MSKPDVFLSFSHDDRSRVEPLVKYIQGADRSVWWDRDIAVRERYRSVISHMLSAASSVVVVWSRSALKSDWVKDEADAAKKRGRLLGTRIEDVQPPLGHGQAQYADLSDWKGDEHPELTRLLRGIANLIEGGVNPSLDYLPDLTDTARRSQLATDLVRRVTVDIQTAASVFKRAPKAVTGLSTALSEVYKTYAAVLSAVEEFSAPLNKATLDPKHYKEIARGRLNVLVQSGRGHCTAVAMAHFGDGGIRQALLNASEEEDMIEKLDRVFSYLSTADGDVFRGMGDITNGLAAEAAAIANMLVAGLHDGARERLQEDAQTLQSLEASLNDHMGELLRVAGELGVTLEKPRGLTQSTS